MTYSIAPKSYHWATLALILVMAATGMAYHYEVLGDGVMTAHQLTGQVLIVVIVVRLITRLTRRSPQTHLRPTNPRTWDRQLAAITHLALYAIMIVYVVSGYVSASAILNNSLIAPVDLAFARSDTGERLLELHYLMKWFLLGAVGLHILGALKHVFWYKDDTFSKMTFTTNKDTTNAKT